MSDCYCDHLADGFCKSCLDNSFCEGIEAVALAHAFEAAELDLLWDKVKHLYGHGWGATLDRKEYILSAGQALLDSLEEK